MKIADALLLQTDLAQEITRLREVAKNDSWRYMQRGTGEDLVPQFDLQENREVVRKLSILKRRLSRAVAQINNSITLTKINDDDYKEWM